MQLPKAAVFSTCVALSLTTVGYASTDEAVPRDQFRAAVLDQRTTDSDKSPPKQEHPPTSTAPNTGIVSASTSLEEVVVTANRRNENLQDVPTTVTALSASVLVNSVVTNTQDLSQVVPGLKFQVAQGFAEPYIRGVGTSADAVGVANPIAIYVDGVYYASPTAGVFALSDVKSVEVDKGPQGTLFGRNATGGVIQITTRDPSAKPSADVMVSFDNYATVTPDLYISGPVAENLASSLTVHFSDQLHGYGKDRYPGINSDVYKTQELDLRNKWLWDPTSLDRIRLSLDFTSLRSTSDVALRFQPGTLPFGYPLTPAFDYNNPWDTYSSMLPYETLKQGGISLSEEHDFGFAKLTSITAYRQTADESGFDFGTPPLQIGASERDLFHQSSQEVRLSSPTAEAFYYTVGLYYINEVGAVDPSVVEGALQPVPIVSIGKVVTNSGAAFGQATYEIIKNTNFTAGLRYTYETASVTGTGTDPRKQNFGKLTWHLALDHRINDSFMVYVADGRGFRAGTYNAEAPGDPPILPEQLDDYEVGFKSNTRDNRLRFNGSGFYYQYSNIQIPIHTITGSSILNGAKAKLYGLDLDLDVKATSQLLLRASLELLHSEFTQFDSAPFNTPLTTFPYGNCMDCFGSAAGHQLPVAPRLVGDLDAVYTVPTSSGSVTLSASYLHNSGWYGDPDNIAKQRAYDKLNARIDWTSPDGRYDVGVFVKNLTDAAVDSRLGSLFFGFIETLEPPRTVGVSFAFHY
ncbi:MAG TPA: TonB-dependent receptor [Terriglobales bacterium]|nr:TonB-dependent receptor [Terriglobales bacterium]